MIHMTCCGIYNIIPKCIGILGFYQQKWGGIQYNEYNGIMGIYWYMMAINIDIICINVKYTYNISIYIYDIDIKYTLYIDILSISDDKYEWVNADSPSSIFRAFRDNPHERSDHHSMAARSLDQLGFSTLHHKMIHVSRDVLQIWGMYGVYLNRERPLL